MLLTSAHVAVFVFCSSELLLSVQRASLRDDCDGEQLVNINVCDCVTCASFLCRRARVYVRSGGEWRERGNGEVKLLKHKTTGYVRIILRQDKTLKLRMNHKVAVTAPAKLTANAGNDKSWVWTAEDFAEEKVETVTFAIRFKDVEMSKAFAAAYEAARASNGKLLESGVKGTHAPSPAKAAPAAAAGGAGAPVGSFAAFAAAFTAAAGGASSAPAAASSASAVDGGKPVPVTEKLSDIYGAAGETAAIVSTYRDRAAESGCESDCGFETHSRDDDCMTVMHVCAAILHPCPYCIRLMRPSKTITLKINNRTCRAGAFAPQPCLPRQVSLTDACLRAFLPCLPSCLPAYLLACLVVFRLLSVAVLSCRRHRSFLPLLLQIRYGAVSEAFRAAFGVEPSFFVRAPGRVNLIGEHIDYHSYGVLPMALAAQDVVIAVSVGAAGGPVKVANRDAAKYPAAELPANPAAPVDAPAADGSRWASYVHCGYKGAFAWARESGAAPEPLGLNLLVDGAVPAGAGVSSSSALVVASLLATARALGVPAALTRAGAAEASRKAEHAIGTMSGGMDQAIACLATAGSAARIEFTPALRAEVVPLPGGASFVVAHSGESAAKGVDPHKGYNLRVVEGALAAKLLAKRLGLPAWAAASTLHDVQSGAALAGPAALVAPIASHLKDGASVAELEGESPSLVFHLLAHPPSEPILSALLHSFASASSIPSFILPPLLQAPSASRWLPSSTARSLPRRRPLPWPCSPLCPATHPRCTWPSAPATWPLRRSASAPSLPPAVALRAVQLLSWPAWAS